MRNIELKARLKAPDRALATCASLGARDEGEIHQIDTYFHVASGRLKLREATPGVTELIYYERPDIAGPKGCDYQRERVSSSMKALLDKALGIDVVVEKRRRLFLWENVRIHLDEVENLGTYIEFEAVLNEESDEEDGLEKLGFLITTFEIEDDAHEEYSYRELSASITD